MQASRITRIAATAVAMALILATVGSHAAEQAAKAPAGWVDAEALGGEHRYLTHISTDKPIYRAGEKVYIRAVVLHAVSRAPLPAREQQHWAQFEVTGPRGDTVAQGQSRVQDSVVGFFWQVPDGQAGGEYTIKVSHPGSGYTPAERSFDIRAYRAPRLKNQITFLRDGYGPGDIVAVNVRSERAEGGTPNGANVTVTARVDGEEVYRGNTTVGDDGYATARFDLPERIARGEGTVAFAIEDGGVVETATKTIPILLQTVDLGIYPESGELVTGVLSRVYVEARTPAKKPADLAGVIVDDTGREVATFRTEHEGRGRFAIVPRPGRSYSLHITEPTGIATVYDLPAATDRGVVIHSPDDVYEAGEPVTLRVHMAPDMNDVTVTIAKRERILVTRQHAWHVEGEGDDAKHWLEPVAFEADALGDAAGVLIATAWDADGQPLAERLIYRRPAETVNVSITPDQSQYVPGGQVKLTVRTTDDAGEPVAAVVGLTVTDDSVLEMIETREQAPRLPVMVLLEADTRELADAHVYLDAANEDAPRALDLLLGTQGWRRFVMLDPLKFIKDHGDDARRVLALRVEPRPIAVRELAMPMAAAGADVRRFGVEAVEMMADGAVAMPDEAEVVRGAQVEDDVAAAPPVEEVANAKQMREQLLEVQDRRDQIGLDAAKADEAFLAQLADRPAPPVMVREYAHAVRPDRQPGQRSDFTETLYWHAGVQTDAESGEAQVTFGLSDAVTSFRATADAFTDSGALGAGSELIESVEPFYIEPKLPLEVTAGDVVLLPVGLVNATSDALGAVTLRTDDISGLKIAGVEALDIAADSRVRRIVPIEVLESFGEFTFSLTAAAGAYGDRVTRPMRVVPHGFPVTLGDGGMLEADGSVAFNITIPENTIANSLRSKVAVYPTPLASMTEALEALIREPYGCFEQTSSTTYPLVMAQQYFMTHTGVDPALIERSAALLDKGYDRLISFECGGNGYEWFGEDPGHEALTAYGLLQFYDMAKVRQVDQAMIARTRQWLLQQRDGKGGFKRERRALHTWLDDPDCSNSYITWALLETGEPAANLESELNHVKQTARESDKMYVVALGANIAAMTGDDDLAKTLMDKLAAQQTRDGMVEQGVTTIVGSGGVALNIETTSLAILAWLRDPSYAGQVEKAIHFIAESIKGGRYGSTQSTVLALRAVNAYDQSRAHPKADGSVQVFVDGQAVGDAIGFTAETKGVIELPDIAANLTPGEHTIELRMTGGSPMPCSFTVDAYNELPDSSEQCKVALDVTLNDTEMTEGDVTEARVTVTNTTRGPVPTPIAIIGIPGGLEVRHDQLKELVKAGAIAAYEVRGREVVLYWRSLKQGDAVTLPISLVAAIPGTYTGPASRAYLYYTDEHKQWHEGVSVDIKPIND